MKNVPLDTHPSGLHYHQLEKDQFRVLEIKSGNPNDILDIDVQLLNFQTLDEHDDIFVPVSYRWKANQRRIPAKVMGGITMIPQGLDRLMRKGRNPEGSDLRRFMWIDQLCINQDDDEDKAHQVPLMRQIYERSLGTIIWLGDEDIDDCDLAVDLMKRWWLLKSENSALFLDTLPLDVILGPPTEENLRSFRALRSFLDCEYWERTWVLQEASTHDQTIIWYDDKEGDSFFLDYVFYTRNLIMNLVARKASPEYGLENTPSAKVGRVELFGFLRTDGQPHSLLELLSLVRRTNCTDPRDKIHAVLSFASDVGDYVQNRFLKPDYSREAFDAYVDVARWHICTAQNLDILGFCASYAISHPLSLPSWVPDWTESSHLAPLPKYLDESIDISLRNPMYSACGEFSYTSQLVFPPPEGYRTNTLYLSGLHIATVCHVLEPISDTFISLSTERSWEDSFEHSACYPLTDETLKDAFDRTIVVDREELDDGGRKYRRGGRLVWPKEDLSTEEYMHQTRFIKRMTRERRLFYAHSKKPNVSEENTDNEEADNSGKGSEQTDTMSADNKIGETGSVPIIGLGRHDVRVGDELWALKGGSVLYVLRRMGPVVKLNISETQCDMADDLNIPDQLWFNGRKRTWEKPIQSYSYHFVGEAYAHGLMDGEAVVFANKDPNERPSVLQYMSSEFEEILLGIGSMICEEAGEDEGDSKYYTYNITEDSRPDVEVPSGKKVIWKYY